jgi:hypothetical protein
MAGAAVEAEVGEAGDVPVVDEDGVVGVGAGVGADVDEEKKPRWSSSVGENQLPAPPRPEWAYCWGVEEDEAGVVEVGVGVSEGYEDSSAGGAEEVDEDGASGAVNEEACWASRSCVAC